MNKKEIEEHRRLLIELAKEKDLKIKELQQRINKAIELVKKGMDFKSIYFKRNEITDTWQILLIDDIKDRFLKILGDKENE